MIFNVLLYPVIKYLYLLWWIPNLLDIQLKQFSISVSFSNQNLTYFKNILLFVINILLFPVITTRPTNQPSIHVNKRISVIFYQFCPLLHFLLTIINKKEYWFFFLYFSILFSKSYNFFIFIRNFLKTYLMHKRIREKDKRKKVLSYLCVFTNSNHFRMPGSMNFREIYIENGFSGPSVDGNSIKTKCVYLYKISLFICTISSFCISCTNIKFILDSTYEYCKT